MKQKLTAMLLASAVTVPALACDGPNSLAEVNVRFATELAGAGGTVANVLGEEVGALAVVPLSAIESINITITGVDAIRGEGDEGYVHLALADEADGRIDLMALPTDGVPLARGEVPAGTYTGLRLRYDVATAEIILSEAITVGQQTFDAGTHTLEVPSGPQTGIKVPFGSLTLAGEDTGDVVLTFDAGTTIRHVSATGSGKLLLVPVLKGQATVED